MDPLKLFQSNVGVDDVLVAELDKRSGVDPISTGLRSSDRSFPRARRLTCLRGVSTDVRPERKSAMDEAARIRKQVGDLQPDDLAQFPIWEFTIDEEGEEGQDEETVKPRPDLDRADPAERLFVVRTEFTSADGTRFEGYASPHEEAQLFYTQPTIVTEYGQVPFWFGGVPPRPGTLEASYQTLGKSAKELFPVRYRALAEHGGATLEGGIDAFMHYESMGSQTIVNVT